jgi:hypothetical protein
MVYTKLWLNIRGDKGRPGEVCQDSGDMQWKRKYNKIQIRKKKIPCLQFWSVERSNEPCLSYGCLSGNLTSYPGGPARLGIIRTAKLNRFMNIWSRIKFQYKNNKEKWQNFLVISWPIIPAPIIFLTFIYGKFLPEKRRIFRLMSINESSPPYLQLILFSLQL